MKNTTPLTILCLLIPALFLGACERSNETVETNMATPAPTAESVTEDERLATFFDEIFERDVNASPMFQAYQGLKTEDYGRWDDFSDEYAQLENKQTAADLERLRSEFDYDQLSESAKMSYRIFEYNQERDLRNFEWRFHNYFCKTYTQLKTARTPSTTFHGSKVFRRSCSRWWKICAGLKPSVSFHR